MRLGMTLISRQEREIPRNCERHGSAKKCALLQQRVFFRRRQSDLDKMTTDGCSTNIARTETTTTTAIMNDCLKRVSEKSNVADVLYKIER